MKNLNIPLLSKETMLIVAEAIYRDEQSRKRFETNWEFTDSDVRGCYMKLAEAAVRAVFGLYTEEDSWDDHWERSRKMDSLMFLGVYGQYVQIGLTIIGAAATVATITPNKSDDRVIQKVLNIVNALGMNVGKASNLS